MGQAKKRGTRAERVKQATDKIEELRKNRRELQARYDGACKTDIRSAAAISLVTALGMNHGYTG